MSPGGTTKNSPFLITNENGNVVLGEKYAQYEKEFKHAKKEFHAARSDKDLKLQLLQYRTDNYTKACRLNLIDLA